MKKKEEINLVEDLKKITENFSESSSLLCIHVNNDEERISVSIGGNDADADIAAAVATCLSMALDGDDDEGRMRVAEIVMRAVSMVIDRCDASSARLCTYLQGRIADFMNEAFVGDDEERDDEDCENCSLMRVCGNEAAVKYRKENHIPRPKKNRAHNNKAN